MDDTSPAIAKKVREMFQSTPAVTRLKMGCSMYDTSRYLVTRAILENMPDISESQLRQELFLKFYCDDFSSVEREKILSHLARLDSPES